MERKKEAPPAQGTSDSMAHSPHSEERPPLGKLVAGMQLSEKRMDAPREHAGSLLRSAVESAKIRLRSFAAFIRQGSPKDDGEKLVNSYEARVNEIRGSKQHLTLSRNVNLSLDPLIRPLFVGVGLTAALAAATVFLPAYAAPAALGTFAAFAAAYGAMVHHWNVERAEERVERALAEFLPVSQKALALAARTPGGERNRKLLESLNARQESLAVELARLEARKTGDEGPCFDDIMLYEESRKLVHAFRDSWNPKLIELREREAARHGKHAVEGQ